MLIWPVETDLLKANLFELMFNPPPLRVAGHVAPNDELRLYRLVDNTFEALVTR
jgi:hypothetical protein